MSLDPPCVAGVAERLNEAASNGGELSVAPAESWEMR
jgi:hypothetical protein